MFPTIFVTNEGTQARDVMVIIGSKEKREVVRFEEDAPLDS
jgi:hypothetical protein